MTSIKSGDKSQTIIDKMSWAQVGINSFAMHIIAMSCMLIDHLFLNSTGALAVLACIGRIAAPLFCFLLVEGFFHTKNLRKYIGRVAIIAIVSEVPHDLLFYGAPFDMQGQNVLFSLLLVLCVLSGFQFVKEHVPYPEAKAILYIGIIITGVAICSGLALDSNFSLLVSVMFYFLRGTNHDNHSNRIVSRLIQVAVMLILASTISWNKPLLSFSLFGIDFIISEQAMAVFSLPIVWLYNGKQGLYNKCVRYSFYTFYPLHLLVLAFTETF